jgi:putative addiction module CopG family antidote
MKGVAYMDVSLPPELERFVKLRISAGLYSNESEVISEALRGLLGRSDQDNDIESLAMIVMMAAAAIAESDLKDLLSKVEAVNEAKAKLREAIPRVATANRRALNEDQIALLLSWLTGLKGSECS